MENQVDPFSRILGSGAGAHAIREFGRRAAAVDAPVLLTGESGTGKGVLARAIHQASARARQPFITVNCAAIPESLFESEFFGHIRGAFTGALQSHRGLFEQANRGTLFLDEVGELPLAMQAKLLTAIEDREIRKVGAERTIQVDARLIAATAAPLEQLVAKGSFRRDLFHRLRVLGFALTPLRGRSLDILELTRHFVRSYAAEYHRSITAIDERALACLRAHAWPGNVRELANTLLAAVLVCDGTTLLLEHIEQALAPAATVTAIATRYQTKAERAEELATIEDALRRCGGNKTKAAQSLGMSRNTLRRKLAQRECDECAERTDR